MRSNSTGGVGGSSGRNPADDMDISALETSDVQFNEMMDSAEEVAELFGIGEESMMPQLVVFCRRPIMESKQFSDIEIMMFGVGGTFETYAKRAVVMQNIGAKLRQDKVIPCAVFLISEAYIATFKNMEDRKHASLADEPGSREVVMMAGRTLHGDCKSLRAIPVKRGDDKKMQRDGVAENFDGPQGTDTRLIDNVFRGFFDLSIRPDRDSFMTLDEVKEKFNKEEPPCQPND